MRRRSCVGVKCEALKGSMRGKKKSGKRMRMAEHILQLFTVRTPLKWPDLMWKSKCYENYAVAPYPLTVFVKTMSKRILSPGK